MTFIITTCSIETLGKTTLSIIFVWINTTSVKLHNIPPISTLTVSIMTISIITLIIISHWIITYIITTLLDRH